MDSLPKELWKEGKKQVEVAKRMTEAEFDVSRLASVVMVEPASHILPPMSQLCKTFMTSLFLMRDPPSLASVKS